MIHANQALPLLAILFAWQSDLEAQEMQKLFSIDEIEQEEYLLLEEEIAQWSKLKASLELRGLLEQVPRED